MKQEELNRIIERHQHYLNQDCESWRFFKANLFEENLERANLAGANLASIDFTLANLKFADLRWADLTGADLTGADLTGADLTGADIRVANLTGAKLIGAKLEGVQYKCTTAFFALVCPEEGSFIAWKKVKRYIIKLRIPEDAKRSSATSRKCRCSHAEVLEIQNFDGSKADVDSVTSEYELILTTYSVGETVYADEWDEDRWNENSHGIHFFITRDEAVNY